MASAGATSAVATEILAAQRLYYDMDPNPGAAIFLVISSQLLAYGIAGLLRGILVQPAKMLWPINIPVNSLMETLHRDKAETAKRIRVFLIVFAVVFVWEIIPVGHKSLLAFRSSLRDRQAASVTIQNPSWISFFSNFHIGMDLPAAPGLLDLLPRQPEFPRLHQPVWRLPRQRRTGFPVIIVRLAIHW